MIQSLHDSSQPHKVPNSAVRYVSPPLTEQLKFIQVSLGPSPDDQVLTLPGLVDSGASATVVCVNALKTAKVLHHFPFTTANKSTKLSLADDTACEILGYIQAYLTFVDKHGCTIPFHVKMIVASSLKHWLYLGSNILYNPQVSHTSPEGLHFKLSVPIFCQPTSLCKESHLAPFLSQEAMADSLACTGTCRSLSNVFLEPQQCTTVAVAISGLEEYDDRNQVTISLSSSDDLPMTDLKVIPVQYVVERNACNILVYNDGVEPIGIAKDLIIAYAEIFDEKNYRPGHLAAVAKYDDALQQTNLHLLTLEETQFQVNELAPSLASSDIQNVQNTLDSKGYCHIPLSEAFDRLEEKRSYSQGPSALGPDDDIGHLLDLSHLTKRQQALVRGLAKFHRKAFAASDAELSACHLVTLDVTIPEVDFSRYVARKHDIPLAQREEVTKILQEMYRAKIIGQAHGPILLISNLMTRRKPNGTLRIILDNRLSNSLSMKIPDLGTATLMEMLNNIRSATLCSSTDLAKSFFQIPCSEALSNLLVFRGPDNNLFRLLRASMGYINSSAALSCCVARMKALPVLSRELSGLIPCSEFESRPLTDEDVELCRSRIPRQVLGNAAAPATGDTTGQPRYSNLSVKNIKKSQMMSMPPNCGIQTYCDDIYLASSHSRHTDEREHLDSLPHDDDFPPASPASPSHVDSFRLPSGRLIETGNCAACTKNEQNPSWNDFVKHMAAWEILLVKLQKAGLKLSPAKTNVAHTKLSFLGATWRPGRISISEARLQAYYNIKITSVRQLHAALASVSYFRHMIPHFSTTAAPLLQVINSKRFQWGSVEQNAWSTLLRVLSMNSSIHLFNPEKEIILSSDSSSVAAAMVLSQQCHGRQRLVACASRTFSKSEVSQSIFHKEILSVIYAFQCFDILLRGAKSITLEIDSRSLLFLRFCRDSSAYLTRLSMIISEYSVVQIIHVNSSCHVVPDKLSRCTAELKKFKEYLKDVKPMSPGEAEALALKIAIENGTVFSNHSETNRISDLTDGQSLPSVLPNAKKGATRFGPTKQVITTDPLTRRERTIKPPPGVTASSANNPKLRLSKSAKLRIKQNKAHSKERQTKAERAERQYFALQQERGRSDTPAGLNVMTRSMTNRAKDGPEAEPGGTGRPGEKPPSVAKATEQDLKPEEGQLLDCVKLNARIISDGLLSLKTFATLQRDDEVFGKIIDKMSSSSPPGNYILKDDLLFYAKDVMMPRICLPTILLPTVVEQHHSNIFSTHSTYTTLVKSLHAKYFHPQLTKVAKEVCRKCLICSVSLTHPVKSSSLGILPLSTKRTLFYADLTLIGKTEYLFIAVDSHSCFTFVKALSSKSESSIYRAILILYSVFFCRALRFDNEAGVFPLLPKIKQLGINVEFIAPHSSQSNGIAERRVGLCKEICRSLRLLKHDLTCDELAALISVNINSRVVFGRRYTAEFLMFNQTIPKHNGIINISEDATEDDKLIPEIEASIGKYIEQRAEAARAQKSKHNSSRRQTIFKQGDIVWCTSKFLITGQKGLRATRTGPYIVKSTEPSNRSCVLRHIETKTIVKRKAAHLSSAAEDFSRVLLNSSWDNQLLGTEPERAPIVNDTK